MSYADALRATCITLDALYYTKPSNLMKSLLTLCCLTLVTLTASAQDETLLSKFTLDFSGAWGGWHSQITEIGNTSTVVHGGFGGLEFNKTVFLGWAAYKNSDIVTDDAGNDRTYDIRFNGPMIAYTPRARSVIHPKFAMHVGFGRLDIDELARDRFVSLQPSVGGEINVLRWFRVGGHVGYRYGLNVDGPGDSFRSPNSFFAEGSLKFGFSWGTNNGGNGLD